VRYRDLNVWALGQALETEIKVSKVLQSLSAKYTIPSPRDARSYTGLTAGLQREDTTSYVSQLVKIEAEQVYGFGKTGTVSAFIQARKENSDAGDQSTNTFLLMPGSRLSDQRYDNVIRPRKGFQYQAELRATHQSLGSSTGFIQILASGDWIIPLMSDLSLTTRARVGATWQNDPVEDLPVSVRFLPAVTGASGDMPINPWDRRTVAAMSSAAGIFSPERLNSNVISGGTGVWRPFMTPVTLLTTCPISPPLRGRAWGCGITAPSDPSRWTWPGNLTLLNRIYEFILLSVLGYETAFPSVGHFTGRCVDYHLRRPSYVVVEYR
jgi:hypothetical protein